MYFSMNNMESYEENKKWIITISNLLGHIDDLSDHWGGPHTET